MREIRFGFVLTALFLTLPGCGDSGPAVGMATDIPAGPPPVPPGTSKR